MRIVLILSLFVVSFGANAQPNFAACQAECIQTMNYCLVACKGYADCKACRDREQACVRRCQASAR